jgi:hypothetical protein
MATFSVDFGFEPDLFSIVTSSADFFFGLDLFSIDKLLDDVFI